MMNSINSPANSAGMVPTSHNAAPVPMAVAPPAPPLKPRKIEKLWPSTMPNPASASAQPPVCSPKKTTHQQHRNGAFEDIEKSREKAGDAAGSAKHIGAAGAATADGAQVDAFDHFHNNPAEGN